MSARAEKGLLSKATELADCRPSGPSGDNGDTATLSQADSDPLRFAEEYLRRSSEILAALCPREIAALIEITRAARDAQQRVFVCGNGGSAATASHFAAGLGKDGSWGRDLRFRALCLNDNMAWVSALANDTDYSQIFVEQLKNHAQPGDVLVAFSSSGNSPNVLRAAEWANENGLVTVGVTGGSGGELKELARHRVGVGSEHMGHVEEAHFLIQHLVTYYFLEPGR